MELRHLRYFAAVAQERHFGRAAQLLHMAQPPLSQQIRALERELGVELLRRTTRRVELTAAGAVYLERVLRVLKELDDATREARLVAGGSVGHLTIGCVGSVTYSLLPQLARGLAAELPGIEVSFRGEMLVPDQVAALVSHDIDLALLRTPIHEPAVTARLLRRDRLVVAVPADHVLAGRRRLTVTDLRGVDLLVHSGRHESVMFDHVVGLCRDAGFEPRIRHEAAETSTLVTLVCGGLGVAVVPEPVAALGLPGVVYLPLRGSGTVDLALARLHDRNEPHLLRAADAVAGLVTHRVRQALQ
jgi:DNA-binding transcriptional LysR family regulator